MSYVVFEAETSFVVGRYSSLRGAKIGAAKARKKTDKVLLVSEAETYHREFEQMVTRTNLMSGKEYQESVNTPLCCSPASETYWSM